MSNDRLIPFRHISLLTASAALLGLGVIVAACSSGAGGKSNDSASVSQEPDEFHADADIAMTVRSIADAIKVGEKLDSADYDFKGTLTDGQGRPLYTDTHGAPGEWVVDILSEDNAVIRNINAGDLLPEDLREYVATNLGLSQSDIVETSEYDDDDETTVEVYDFGEGLLRFETRNSPAPGGTDAIFVTIALRAHSDR